MFSCGALALAAMAMPAVMQAAALATVALAYLALIALIERSWRRRGANAEMGNRE
jgi:hypothetical protein